MTPFVIQRTGSNTEYQIELKGPDGWVPLPMPPGVERFHNMAQALVWYWKNFQDHFIGIDYRTSEVVHA